MRRFHVWYAVGGMALCALLPGTVSAQGFSVNEHSTCAMGRAGTATATPCRDGSAMFFNPAGLTDVGRGQTVFSVGGTFIAPSGGFTDDQTGLSSDLKDRVFPVPHVYAVRGLTDRITAGIGVFAPYGLTTDWPSNAIGRFSSYKSVIRNIYIQPTLAARLGKYVSVGAGFDLNLVHLQLRQRVDLSEQNTPTPGVTFGMIGIPAGTDFADVDVTGSSKGVGYHVGVIVNPTDRIAFGARYLSRQKVEIDDGEAEIRQVNTGILLPPGNRIAPAGTPLDAVLAAQFQPGGPLVNQSGATAVRLPEQLSFGVAFKATDRLRLLADYTRTNWEVWDTIVLDFELLPTAVLPQDFEPTNAFRFGGEYDVGTNTVVRLGFLTHDAAAPDQTVTPTLPEGPRSEFTAGFGTRIGGRAHLDLAYQYIDQADRRGRSGAPGTPNNGLYEFSAHLVGATLSFTF